MTYTRLNPKEERITLGAASGITRGDLILTRIGNVVNVSGHFYSSSNIAGDAPIFQTIPAAWRPPYTYAIPGIITTSEGNVAGFYVTVDGNGKVSQGMSSLTRSGAFSGQYELSAT